MNTDALAAQLTIDEGKRSKPYTDTVGKTTIGVGRNLTDVGISDDEISLLLTNDIKRVCDLLDENISWWRDMSEARQQVIANMCFNMGINGLLGFKNTLEAMQEGRYDAAANGMLASLWARQTGDRAQRLAEAMRNG